jgi:hypothetical protein
LKGDEESGVVKWKKWRHDVEKYFNQREDEIKNEEDEGLGGDGGMDSKIHREEIKDAQELATTARDTR